MTGINKMAHKNRCPGIALRVAAMMLLMWNLQLSAATLTWTSTGGSNNWTPTATNWTCTGTPCIGGITAELVNADVIFPSGLAGSHLGPVTGAITLSLDSLKISGSEYTQFVVSAGATLSISNGTTSSNFDLTGTGAKTSTVSNSGTILVTSGTLNNQSGIFLNSGGALTLSGIAIVNNAGGGAISNTASGGSFVIGSGATVENGTLVGGVTNNGTITSTIGNSLTFSSAVVNGGAAVGAINSLAGTLTTDATANTFGATTALNNTGSLTAGSGGSVHWIGGANSGTLSSGSGALTVSGTVTNTGTINAVTSGTTTVASVAGPIPAGEITGSGTVDVSGGTLNIASGGEITGSGILDETSGVVTLSGTLAVATANLLGGTFDGTGSFTGGNVTNDIVLDVNGSAAAWGGSATLGDYAFTDYTQEAGGTLAVNFTATSNDELIDASNTTLAGTLDLLNQNGTALTFGSLTNTSYVLVADTGSAVSGTFSSLNVALPTGWSLVYNGANTPGGDDGDVELDFTAPPATPEPTTDILLGAAIIGLGLMRKKFVKR
jgi:hypothetical protein